jgi:uncharacterized protein
MRYSSWILKPSKLCNLRCRYCYEWDHLGDTARISLDGWRRIFEAVRDHDALLEARDGDAPSTHLIWHGGEATLLPPDYVDAVQALKLEVLGPRARIRRYYQDSIQTNAYRMPDETIDWLRRHRFSVGVSCDFVPGVRLALGGQATEQQVVANMERMRAAGVPHGLIVVLARHTLPKITRIHDYLVEHCFANLRVLPLFAGPAARPSGGYEATADELVEGLKRLFVHWLDHGSRIEIAPFSDYLQVAIRRMLGITAASLDRRVAEPMMIVNTDGGLYISDETYAPETRLGNVFEQSLGEIFASPAYAASLAATETMQRRHCHGCEYFNNCSTQPLFESSPPGHYEGRCSVAYRMHAFVEDYLRNAGFDADELRLMLRQELGFEDMPPEGPLPEHHGTRPPLTVLLD